MQIKNIFISREIEVNRAKLSRISPRINTHETPSQFHKFNIENYNKECWKIEFHLKNYAL